MRRTSLLSLFAALLVGACAPAAPHPAAPAADAARGPLHAGLNIKHTSVYVDDQATALAFYTDVLGFTVKDDVTNGPYRWLTVVAPADPDGTELQLALADTPAAAAYQDAMAAADQPAVMFFTADVAAEYERLTARGAEFTMAPTDVTVATIAQLRDPSGNLIQLTQLAAP